MILCGVTAVLTASFCSTPLDTLVHDFKYSGRDTRLPGYAQLALSLAAAGAEHSGWWYERFVEMTSSMKNMRMLEWLTKYERCAYGYATPKISYLNHY